MKLKFFIATIILFGLGQLGRISFFSQNINIYLYEIPLVFFILSCVLEYKTKPIKKLGNISYPIFSFLFVTFFSYIVGLFQFTLLQNVIGFLYYLRLSAYLLFIIYGYYECFKNKKNLKIALYGYIMLSVWIVMTAVIQYMYYPDLRNLIYQGWDPHLYRVFGVFFEPYLAASGFGIIFFITAHFFKSNKKYTYIFVFLLIASFILLFLTFSRAAYIAFSATVGLFLIHKKKYIYIFIFLIITLIVIYLIPKPVGVGVQLQRTFSIMTRYQNNKEGIRIWMEHPFLGVGFNRIAFSRKDYTFKTEFFSHAASSFHSSFITILASTGILGFMAFSYMLFRLLSVSKRFALALIFILILSQADNAILHPFILYLLGLSFMVNASN